MTAYTYRLPDHSKGIRIGPAGAPEPTSELLDWLAVECPGTWRIETDTAANLEFHFREEAHAACFKARWGASEL